MFYIGVIWFASALIAMQWFFLTLALYAVEQTFPDALSAALAWAKTMTGYDPVLIFLVAVSTLSLGASYYIFSKQEQIS